MNRFLIATCLATLLGAPAFSATFTDEASFLAAAPGATFDDFESSTFDGTTVTFGGGTTACTGGNYCDSFYGNSFGSPDQSLSGTKAVFFGTPDTLTFYFDTAITAFGIFIGGAGDVGAQTLTAQLSDNSLFNVLTDYVNGGGGFSGNTNYFGVTSDTAFTSISFTGLDIGDGVFFDNLSYKTAVATVPLPAGGLLLVGALAGLAGMRRRKV
jgi:hypothetical protein